MRLVAFLFLILALAMPAQVRADDDTVFPVKERPTIVVPDLHVHASDIKYDHVFRQPPVVVVKECDNKSWTTLEWVMAWTTTALIVTDMSQTFSFTSRGIPEANPLLPRYPSRNTLRAVTVGSLALYWGGSAALRRPYRTMWQTAYLVGEGYAVSSNEFVLHSGYKFPW